MPKQGRVAAVIMNPQITKWIKFGLRWGIAIGGIAWVLMNTSFKDRVMLLGPDNLPDQRRLLDYAGESDSFFRIVGPGGHGEEQVSRGALWTRPERRSVSLRLSDGTPKKVKLLAYHPADGRLLILDPSTNKGRVIDASDVVGRYKVVVPYPLVDIGIDRLVREADWRYLLASLLVLPISYVVTSRRWHRLLDALEIHLSVGRTFVLNMVGAFYNTFMPGSTGGDLIRAYYASKHTTHRVRAVLSVIVDRVIGLIALIILGGTMAALQFRIPDCRRVAIACASLMGLTILGLFVFYHPRLRRLAGVDFILTRLPMQRHVAHVVEALELYGKRPFASLFALLISFPVHVTTIVSATLAGLAFGVKMSLFYFWVCVPVIVLVGAIPISPQGAGVMEFFAVQLTKTQGVTVSQAFALAMSIRVGAMFWNLVAGLFVLRGGYHAPTSKEQEELETDRPDAAPGKEQRPAGALADVDAA